MKLFSIGKKDSKTVYEAEMDRKLMISTMGRDDSNADEYHHPYEPTPYTVLRRLAESGYITGTSKVIDYGCGKGRVGFFLNYELGCRVTGVEYDERIFQQAVDNQRCYARKQSVEFVCQRAEVFEVGEADCFYFFNPFSVKILMSVLGQLIESYYENPRDMRLFFYYPSDDYVGYLMTVPELNFLDEIDCRDLFGGKDDREKILIFEVEGLGFGSGFDI